MLCIFGERKRSGCKNYIIGFGKNVTNERDNYNEQKKHV